MRRKCKEELDSYILSTRLIDNTLQELKEEEQQLLNSLNIHVGIDEITIVIQPTEDTIGEYPQNWSQIAMELTATIADKLSMPLIFDSLLIKEKIAPKGYTHAFSFNNMPYFFRIAFHEKNFTMGVIIKFSASALNYYKQAYQELYKESLEVYDILKKLDEDYWDMHLSRIDFTADYFNYPLTVNEIYTKLKNRQFKIVNARGRRNHSKKSAIETDGEAKTITIGSRKKGSNSFLKIYDKLSEQLEKNGTYVHIANKVKSWVRFEVTYRHIYAKQLTKSILDLQSADDLQQLIASKIVEKYCLIDVEKEQVTEYSQALIDFSSDTERFETMSPRNNSLVQNIHHILKGSGFFSTLYKVEEIWGADAVITLLERVLSEYRIIYIPNKDVKIWLDKNSVELQKLDFNDYLDSIIDLFYFKTPLSQRQSDKIKKRKRDR